MCDDKRAKPSQRSHIGFQCRSFTEMADKFSQTGANLMPRRLKLIDKQIVSRIVGSQEIWTQSVLIFLSPFSQYLFLFVFLQQTMAKFFHIVRANIACGHNIKSNQWTILPNLCPLDFRGQSKNINIIHQTKHKIDKFTKLTFH